MVIWPGVSAVPVTVAAIGLLPSPTVSVASLGPAAPTGWKATRTVQLPPAATVAPGQVPPVTAKSSASLNMTARAPLVLPPSLVTVSASGDDVSPSATEATSRVAGAIESTGGGASVTGASGDGASAGAAASGIDASGVSAAPGRTHRFVPGWHTKLCGHAPFEPQASSAAATSGLVQAAQSTATTRRDPKLPMRRRGKHGRCRRWRK